MSDPKTTDKRDGPLAIVTTRLTCEGCRHLATEQWEFEGENDEIQWGTRATCAAMPGLKSITAYWRPETPTPAWCPRRIDLQ